MTAPAGRAAVLTPTAALRWRKRQDEVRRWVGDSGEIAVHGSILLHLAASAAAARRDGDVHRFFELATEADRWTHLMWRWVQPARRTRHVAGADEGQAREMVLALAEEAAALLGDASERPWVDKDAQNGLITALTAARSADAGLRLVAGDDPLTSGVAQRLGVSLLTSQSWLTAEGDHARVPAQRRPAEAAKVSAPQTVTVLAPGAAAHALAGGCARPVAGQVLVLVDVLVAVLVAAVRGTGPGTSALHVVEGWWSSGIVPVAPSLADYRRAAMGYVFPFFDSEDLSATFDPVQVDQAVMLALAVVEGLAGRGESVRVLVRTAAEREVLGWAARDGRWDDRSVTVEACC